MAAADWTIVTAQSGGIIVIERPRPQAPKASPSPSRTKQIAAEKIK
jgi:hypothetical protein